jgi:predicted permease
MPSSFLADVRYSLRWLLRSPGFTLVAVLSLAIGIGFNTALFSIVDAELFRPRGIRQPDRIVDVYTRGADGDTYSTSSYPDYIDLRDRNHVFSGLAGYSPALAAIKANAGSRMALAETVTGNYFQVLGVGAAVGRTLLPEDDRPGTARVAVISYRAWQRDFGGGADVVGRTMLIHGQPYTIVGVVARRYQGVVPMLQPEVWTATAWVQDVEPAGIQDVVPSPGNTRLERRGQRWMFLKGRLKDGETVARAEADLTVIGAQLAAAYPKSNERRDIAVAANVRIHPVADRALKTVAMGLIVAIGLVLLVACANVANMLLARASGRRKEIGIRLAIGASRGRVLRQLLTESAVLAALGGAAGILMASWALRALASAPLPTPVPLTLDLRLDSRVLIFTAAVAIGTGLLAGLAPALRATRLDLTSDLKESVAERRSKRWWTLGDMLAAAQTAVTLVLLVAAGLLTRSILHAQQVDLGFRPRGVVALSTELSLIGYDAARATTLYERAEQEIAALPGVTSVARALRQPLAINYNRDTVFFPDRQQTSDRGTSVSATWADEHYLSTLGVPLLRGRNFTPDDKAGSPAVAIVTESFVRRFFPGTDGLGRRFRRKGLAGQPDIRIVGVVGDYKVETIGEAPTPYIQYALRQSPDTGTVLIARTTADTGALLASMRKIVLSLEPNAIFLDSQSMNAQVDTSLLPARIAAEAIVLVGVVAMLLAAIGLYGIVAYAVGRRTREIGIRMAVGAAPSEVLGMIMRQGLAVAAVGMLAGGALAFVAARAVASALYGITAADPGAWTAAIGVLLTSAALANYIPARRASRVDPSIALRNP